MICCYSIILKQRNHFVASGFLHFQIWHTQNIEIMYVAIINSLHTIQWIYDVLGTQQDIHVHNVLPTFLFLFFFFKHILDNYTKLNILRVPFIENLIIINFINFFNWFLSMQSMYRCNVFYGATWANAAWITNHFPHSQMLLVTKNFDPGWKLTRGHFLTLNTDAKGVE